MKMICFDGDNHGALLLPGAIIIIFFVDTNSCRCSCSFIACL
ncbi:MULTISPECIES: hypothetical protein [unclassified Okeania]|nr:MULTISPECIES: hypothetical protein [unclassified Okeania]